MISDNIKNISERIENAKNRARRKDGIKLVAVTKTIAADKIEEALRGGITDIGENRVREAEKKFPVIRGLENIRKHLIGHLQTNKVKTAVRIFDVIQSVDSVHLLEEIDRQSAKIRKIQECFTELKVSEEETKYGLASDDLEGFLEKARNLENVKITGIMAMAPFFESPEYARPYFRRAYECYSLLATRYSLTYLSMGMTNDFEIAIEEGANMVRIGTGIFGEKL